MRVRPHIPFLSSSRIHFENAVRVIRCTRRTGDALDHRRCSARCSSRTRRRPWYAQVHQGVLRQRVGYSQMMRARRPSVSVDLHCPAVLRSRLQLEGGTAVELSSRLFAHTHMRRHPPRTSSGWHSPLRQCIIFGGSRGGLVMARRVVAVDGGGGFDVLGMCSNSLDATHRHHRG